MSWPAAADDIPSHLATPPRRIVTSKCLPGLLGFKPKPKQPAFAACVFRCLPKSRALPRQQIRDPHLEKGGICRIGVRIARAMTPHARDRPQGPGCKIRELSRI